MIRITLANSHIANSHRTMEYPGMEGYFLVNGKCVTVEYIPDDAQPEPEATEATDNGRMALLESRVKTLEDRLRLLMPRVSYLEDKNN